MTESVLHVGTHAAAGGAGRALWRIHTALSDYGYESRIISQRSSQYDSAVVSGKTTVSRILGNLGYHINHLPLGIQYLKGNIDRTMTPAWAPSLLKRQIKRFCSPQTIVHLHWVAGFATPRVIRWIADHYPTVWTLHDCWAVTGDCHYPMGCRGYTESCGTCPALASSRERDWTRFSARRKRTQYGQSPIEYVVPSPWMREQVHQSAIVDAENVTIIPNPLNTDRFAPVSQKQARTKLDLPTDIPLIGYSANAEIFRKGTDLLQTAISETDALSQRGVELVRFGHDSPSISTLPRHDFGHISDNLLPVLYSALDTLVVPSRYESFGQVASESISCGTPVASFDTSGLRSVVTDGKTGSLAPPFDSTGLGRAIVNALELDTEPSECHAEAERRFSPEIVAAQYDTVYSSVQQ